MFADLFLCCDSAKVGETLRARFSHYSLWGTSSDVMVVGDVLISDISGLIMVAHCPPFDNEIDYRGGKETQSTNTESTICFFLNYLIKTWLISYFFQIAIKFSRSSSVFVPFLLLNGFTLSHTLSGIDFQHFQLVLSLSLVYVSATEARKGLDPSELESQAFVTRALGFELSPHNWAVNAFNH